MKKIAVISLFVIVVWASAALAVSVSVPEKVGQGEPFLVEISSQQSPLGIKVAWMGKTVDYPVELPGRQVILLGAGLDHRGVYPLDICLELSDMVLKKNIQIVIEEKEYPVQRLSLPAHMITPPAEVIERIAREREKTLAALNALETRRYWTGEFIRPVTGEVSSPFGVRRFLNDEPRAPHRGVDLRGSEGTPVKALDTGRVTLTGDFYFGGRTVIIDHGLGFQTVYMHLSEITVSYGDLVTRGDLVGLVGMTGRATGPHLHLGVYILGEAVDPLPLLEW